MTGYHKDALPTGYQLAEYVIETILGHGGFGITYLAKDVQLGTQVAIKEYLPQDFALRKGATTIVPNPEGNTVVTYQCGLKEFLREGQALARFKHSNIVRVLRFIEANGTAYMVMEYEKGTSLSQHLKGNGARLDEAKLLRIFLPIMNGLQAVHEAGMLHLDIKPENIYLREDGTPMKVIGASWFKYAGNYLWSEQLDMYDYTNITNLIKECVEEGILKQMPVMSTQQVHKEK